MLKRVSNNEQGLKCPPKGSQMLKRAQITNKVSNVEWKVSQILKRASNNE